MINFNLIFVDTIYKILNQFFNKVNINQRSNIRKLFIVKKHQRKLIYKNKNLMIYKAQQLIVKLVINNFKVPHKLNLFQILIRKYIIIVFIEKI